MGLQQDIDYRVGKRNGLRRGLLRILGSSAGSWLMSKVITSIDRWVYRMSRGRYTASSAIGGLPVIMLTTVGAKSGIDRKSPLVAIPIGEDLAVIGSNFAQARTPGWVHNLLANPRATVTYRDVSIQVVARSANDTEYEQIFEMTKSIYPGFSYYRERVSGRKIRVLVLSVDDEVAGAT
jgi:deazaflavin-dependent oxidoreductase (nitroreductase family)